MSTPAAAGVPAVCSVCGAAEAEPPLTWLRDIDDRRGPTWICDSCARTHLRAIEARLSQEWW